MSADKYLEILESLKGLSDSDKLIRVAGVITDYVKERFNIDLIVVGGLSVEIYTDGGYSTQDIDFIGPGHEKIMQALTELGFQRMGKDSIHEDLKVFIEVPDSTLKDADEEYVRHISTKDGFILKVIGIEDIIKDRIKALIYWDEFAQEEWIYQLVSKHLNSLDIDYIRNTSSIKEREVFDQFHSLILEVDESKTKNLNYHSF